MTEKEHTVLPGYGARIAESLRNVLPFAANEIDSLHNAERRDHEDLGASAATRLLDAAQEALNVFDKIQDNFTRSAHVDRMNAPQAAAHYLQTHGGTIRTCFNDLKELKATRNPGDIDPTEPNEMDFETAFIDHELKALDEALAVVEPKSLEQQLIALLTSHKWDSTRVECSEGRESEHLVLTLIDYMAWAGDVDAMAALIADMESNLFKQQFAFIVAFLCPTREEPHRPRIQLGYGQTLLQALEKFAAYRPRYAYQGSETAAIANAKDSAIIAIGNNRTGNRT